MELVKVKKNYQITIPQSIRKDLEIKEGQFLEIETKNNNLILKPVKITSKGDK